jgi:hypothetical protein
LACSTVKVVISASASATSSLNPFFIGMARI